MYIELLLLLFVASFLIYYLHKTNKPAGTPPGSIGYPIVGCIPPSNISFEECINNYRKKYGDIFWLKIGSKHVVFVCNYENIVKTFSNPAVQGRPQIYSNFIIHPGVEKGIIFSEGRRWQDVRRFVIRRLRDGGMGKTSLESIILREANDLAHDFGKYVGKPTELPWSINSTIVNVIWKLVSDKRYDIGSTEINTLTSNVTDILNLLQGGFFNLMDSMPWLEACTPEFIKNLLGQADFQQKYQLIIENLRKIVKEHKESIDNDNPRDLIDYYLIEISKQKNGTLTMSEISNYFCEQELIHVIFDLFAAGSETTSSTIRWYLLLMAKFPEIQRKVHEELDRVIPKDRSISLCDKENLPFFEATIWENLRLKSILPFGLFHVATEDTIIDKYYLPKGTLVKAHFQAYHKNEKYWEKPNEFYPKHFLNEDMTFNHKIQGILSFSTGRRVCLGENLARMDLFIVLATLMQKFTFTAPEGESLSIEQSSDQPFFTIPKPFKIIINKR